MYNKTLVRKFVDRLARRQIVRVEFTKRDGSNRVMFCNLGEKGKVDRSIITVRDLEANQYRSIRKNSLISVS
jgi:hypothetical protein